MPGGGAAGSIRLAAAASGADAITTSWRRDSPRAIRARCAPPRADPCRRARPALAEHDDVAPGGAQRPRQRAGHAAEASVVVARSSPMAETRAGRAPRQSGHRASVGARTTAPSRAAGSERVRTPLPSARKPSATLGRVWNARTLIAPTAAPRACRRGSVPSRKDRPGAATTITRSAAGSGVPFAGRPAATGDRDRQTDHERGRDEAVPLHDTHDASPSARPSPNHCNPQAAVNSTPASQCRWRADPGLDPG